MVDRALHTRILNTLNNAGFDAYIVGGYVRDTLLGLPSKDIDIATSAQPHQLQDLFPNCELIGAHFGVILVREGDEAVEVATFRTDGVYNDGRRPSSVRFTTDVREDVKRRDFTINALVMHASGTIHDHVGGYGSLGRRIIETVGDPHARFQEDHLRMLRAIRFACKLDFEIEQETWLALSDNAHLILDVSAERVRDELSRILTSGRAARGIDLLVKSHLARYILPELLDLIGVGQNPAYHPEGDVYTHTLSLLQKLEKGCSLTLALAALLHDIGKPATLGEKDGQPTFHGHEDTGQIMAADILVRLKYPNEVIETVTSHVAQHMRFRVAREMRRSKLYRFLRQPNFAELLALHRLDASSGSGDLSSAEFVESVLGEVPPEVIHPPRLLTGEDLIVMGFTPGPLFGTILEALETEQLEGRVTTRDEAVVFACCFK